MKPTEDLLDSVKPGDLIRLAKITGNNKGQWDKSQAKLAGMEVFVSSVTPHSVRVGSTVFHKTKIAKVGLKQPLKFEL